MIFKRLFSQKITNRHKQHMNRVLYALFHLDSLDEVKENNFMYNVYPQFVEYDLESQQAMLDSIKWALQHKDIQATHSLPDLPYDSNFIRQYLTIVLSHLEKDIKA